ncbi:MAG TPA: FAD-dependent oxidoreductase, partial [Spirochaetia bacterium]|nr:FAD-dependent oxidoreductase [Spirochaetia bacterium]
RRFLEGLSDPLAVEAFGNLVHFGGTDVPLLTVLLPLAYAHRRMTGIPRGGWISFARAIEARLGELGGRVLYGARVVRLKIESGKVRGVALADGREFPADRVLSAADGRFTRSLLPGGSSDGAEFDPRRMSDQPVQVNLGVAEDWSEYPGPLTWLLPDAPSAAGRPQHRLTVHHRCYDPASAPAGKSALMAFLESDYGFWKDLEADRARYEAEKRRCADIVVQAVQRFRPGFAGKVEVTDVSTPRTRERYTGNYMGTMQARKPDAGMIRTLLRGAARYDDPGLDGFWRAGQWVEAWGGITTAAQSGRNAIRAMCRRDGVPFAPGLRGDAA